MAVTSRMRGGGTARGDASRDAGRCSLGDRDGAGRDGHHVVLTRERVSDLKRARVLAAMTELTRERGVRGVSVSHVVARSGVSRRTFYELFDDREDCLLAAFEHATQRVAEVVLPAFEAAGDWRDRSGRASRPRSSSSTPSPRWVASALWMRLRPRARCWTAARASWRR